MLRVLERRREWRGNELSVAAPVATCRDTRDWARSIQLLLTTYVQLIERCIYSTLAVMLRHLTSSNVQWVMNRGVLEDDTC